MNPGDKPLVWLHGEVKTPPFGSSARIEVGFLLRRLQRGEQLSMPHARPMAQIGTQCFELRITDAGISWRLVYRIDADAIVIAEVFSKKSARTPAEVLSRCRRLMEYDNA